MKSLILLSLLLMMAGCEKERVVYVDKDDRTVLAEHCKKGFDKVFFRDDSKEIGSRDRWICGYIYKKDDGTFYFERLKSCPDDFTSSSQF